MAAGSRRWKRTLAARQLRANATPAEARLWKQLSNRKAGGFKFRRQEPLGDYFADFFCAEAKLVVELDGGIHLLKAEQDAVRTQWLEDGGLHVLRFANEDVLSNIETVVAKIIAACEQRLSSADDS